MMAPRPCVLLVEEHAVARRALVRNMLQQVAHVVDVESVEAALAVLDTGTVIDVVVADMGSVGTSGIELFEALRVRYPLMTSRLVVMVDGDARRIDDTFRSAIGERLLLEPVDAEELQVLVIAVAGSSDVAAE